MPTVSHPEPSVQARKHFKGQVRRLTRRNNGQSMYQIIHDLNQYLPGWVGYYRLQEFRKVFWELDAFIRSRLRSLFLDDSSLRLLNWSLLVNRRAVYRPVCAVLSGGGGLIAPSYRDYLPGC
ncbi:MAG: hypothetical protein O7G88_09565 [bacterium]|nr:hypothetical protein [bacterium]